jgi:hypothetical protein
LTPLRQLFREILVVATALALGWWFCLPMTGGLLRYTDAKKKQENASARESPRIRAGLRFCFADREKRKPAAGAEEKP